MRYGLHSFSRRIWVKKGVRPVCPSPQRYQWGSLYGAVGVGLARSEFFYAETVDQEHLAAYYEQIGQSDPAAVHVLIQDGAENNISVLVRSLFDDGRSFVNFSQREAGRSANVN